MTENVIRFWNEFSTDATTWWDTYPDLRWGLIYLGGALLHSLFLLVVRKVTAPKGEPLVSYSQIPQVSEAETRHKVFLEMLQKGVLGVDEIRAHYGLPPLSKSEIRPNQGGSSTCPAPPKPEPTVLRISPIVQKVASILDGVFRDVKRSTYNYNVVLFEEKNEGLSVFFTQPPKGGLELDYFRIDVKGVGAVSVKSSELNLAELDLLNEAGRLIDKQITTDLENERKRVEAHVLNCFLQTTPKDFSTESLERELQSRKETNTP